MCKYCFQSQIPQSTSSRFILKPNGRLFVNGISSSYEIIYFNEFKPHFNQVEYEHLMNRIIEGHSSMWPCDFCFYFGYLLSPCTLGLSLLLPNLCLKEAKAAFISDITDANVTYFHPARFHLSLQQRCCVSWLQIEKIDHEEKFDSHTTSIEYDKKEINLINNQIN